MTTEAPTQEIPETYKQMAQIRSEQKGQAPAEAPLTGVSPIVAEAPVAPAPEATPAPVEAAPVPEPAVEEKKEEILIDGKVFTSEREAIKYAQKLSEEKQLAEAYNQGIRDSLQATLPVQQEVVPEDNFEQEFYTDPKKTLKKVKEEAKHEALEAVRAEQTREAQWTTFLSRYPDIERRDAELILQTNMDVFGKLTDTDKAMQLLATKTRAEYQRIADKFLPKKELSNRTGQVVSASNSASPVVTTPKKAEEALDFVSQLKNHKARR